MISTFDAQLASKSDNPASTTNNRERFEVRGLRPEALPSGTPSNLTPLTSNILPAPSTLTSTFPNPPLTSNLRPPTFSNTPPTSSTGTGPEVGPKTHSEQMHRSRYCSPYYPGLFPGGGETRN